MSSISASPISIQTIITLFENEDFLIINKPAQISFHNEDNQLGIHSLLKSHLNRDIWPVHRLDKITSGLLIFGKTKLAAQELGKMFEQGLITKTYIALSDKKPKKKQGQILGDMKKSRSGNWKLCQTKDNPAKTRFKSCSLIPGIRFFYVTPTTGKTHQIRVALKSIGSPILGDKRYSGGKSDRGYLHAYRLQFSWKKELIDIDCLPDFGEHFLLSELKNVLQVMRLNQEPQIE